MSSSAVYTLLGLTAIVAGLVGILVFALLKFFAAAREARGQGGPGAERSSAVADALANAITHAHAGQVASAEARAATAFRLLVGDRARAIQAAIDALPDSAGEPRVELARLASSLNDLVGRHEPPPGPVDLRSVIAVAVSGYRITARSRGGDVLVQGEFATVVCQSDALDYTFTALVSAVLDSCQRAGIAPVVAIRGERDEAARRIRIFVDDNGPGGWPPPERGDIAGVVERAGGRMTEGESPMGGAQICLDLPIAPPAQ